MRRNVSKQNDFSQRQNRGLDSRENGIEYPHAKGDFGLWMNYA